MLEMFIKIGRLFVNYIWFLLSFSFFGCVPVVIVLLQGILHCFWISGERIPSANPRRFCHFIVAYCKAIVANIHRSFIAGKPYQFGTAGATYKIYL